MLHLICSHLAMVPHGFMRWQVILKSKLLTNHAFVPSKLPTQPSIPSIFSSFSLGALELANPDPSLFFWLPSYISLPLFLPRLRLSF